MKEIFIVNHLIDDLSLPQLFRKKLVLILGRSYQYLGHKTV